MISCERTANWFDNEAKTKSFHSEGLGEALGRADVAHIYGALPMQIFYILKLKSVTTLSVFWFARCPGDNEYVSTWCTVCIK